MRSKLAKAAFILSIALSACGSGPVPASTDAPNADNATLPTLSVKSCEFNRNAVDGSRVSLGPNQIIQLTFKNGDEYSVLNTTGMAQYWLIFTIAQSLGRSTEDLESINCFYKEEDIYGVMPSHNHELIETADGLTIIQVEE